MFGACIEGGQPLGPGEALAPAPVVAPQPVEVFEAGTGGGAMQDSLLVRVLSPTAEGQDELTPDVEVWIDSQGLRSQGRTDDRGEVRFEGLAPPVDVHVFGASLYRTVLDVRAAALTVRLGLGGPRQPSGVELDWEVPDLDALEGGPVRFAHVRHWAWPRAGGLRQGYAVSEDVAVSSAALPDSLRGVRVTVPEDLGGALLVLVGSTEQERLTSWGREVGWDSVNQLAMLPVSSVLGAIAEPPRFIDLSDTLTVNFVDAPRYMFRVGATRWEARYELVHPEWGQTRALAAGGGGDFGQDLLQLRLPAPEGAFEDVTFRLTVRAYAGDWWVAERTLEVRRGVVAEVDGFASGRPGLSRDGRDLEFSVPSDAGFARLIFQAREPQWWVDALEPSRRRATLPRPPVGRPDPLESLETPLIRAHFFRGLNPQVWNAAARPTHLGLSVER